MNVDPDGHCAWVVAGAVIGGIISAGIKVAANRRSKRKWSDGLFLAFVGGAGSGALAATGVGLFGQVAGNALIGAGSYAIGQMLNKKNIKMSELGMNAGLGAISGRIGGSGLNGRALTGGYKYASSRIARELRRKNIKSAMKNMAKYKSTKYNAYLQSSLASARYAAGGYFTTK